jgi:flagellar biosynthesis GTPase FlhF
MELVTFIAETAAEAAAQVRDRLGPHARVVHIRPLAPVRSSWWSRPRARFEVLAHGPVAAADGVNGTGDEGGTRLETGSGDAHVHGAWVNETGGQDAGGLSGAGRWRVGGLLERSGLLPVYAQRVMEAVRRQHGEEPPGTWGEELARVREVMRGFWRVPTGADTGDGRVHLLVGSPGSGSTTCLCKWLTQWVLGEGRRVRVGRLDGRGANTAEWLGLHAEILGVPVERRWSGSVEEDEVALLDVPGVDGRDGGAVADLGRRLKDWGSPTVHLVLNAAYEVPALLRQVRGMEELGLADLVVTHLDEEPRWGKIWNLVLGTNCSVRFLNAGQNIPGDFSRATPESLLARDFRT